MFFKHIPLIKTLTSSCWFNLHYKFSFPSCIFFQTLILCFVLNLDAQTDKPKKKWVYVKWLYAINFPGSTRPYLFTYLAPLSRYDYGLGPRSSASMIDIFWCGSTILSVNHSHGYKTDTHAGQQAVLDFPPLAYTSGVSFLFLLRLQVCV